MSLYTEEKQKLKQITEKIGQQIAALEKIPRYYGNHLVEQILDDQRQKKLRDLRHAYSQLYFGRLDFEEGETNQITPLYIGKIGVEDEAENQPLIIDWRAPVASMFYSFTGKGDTASYISPDGLVEGVIHLKRNIVIRKQKLERVVDSYVRGKENMGLTDEFLLYRLSENKDHRLRDIVSTIQLEQDQIIRADRSEALIIQGVPGSGKTTVALHRLAFLLYQYRQRIRAERIVIFAPNQMFLDYISDVLPELGVGDIQQTTFRNWAMEILKSHHIELEELKTSPQAKQFDKKPPFLTQTEKWDRLRGSIDFLHYLKRAFAYYESHVVPKRGILAWDDVFLSEETIRTWFEIEYKHEPLMKRKERVFARIKRWLESAYKEIRSLDPKGLQKKEAMKRMRAYMKAWPKHNLIELYHHLLITPLPSSDLDIDLSIIRQNINLKVLDCADLAPLVYLHTQLYGVDQTQLFDHIVIDEAQDFSPLQVAVLQEYCPSGSFTILGDILQNIFGGQGIRHWNEFQSLFPIQKVRFYQLQRSYRSTTEIIQFANQVIDPYRGEIERAIPVFRSGDPVQCFQMNSFQEIMTWVQDAFSQGSHTVAVVTPTEMRAKEAYRMLMNAELKPNLITSQQDQYLGGLSVAPIYLVKGMEFDAVILLDVDDQFYPENEQCAKLLFVGCTRALHRLSLAYQKEISPLVPQG
ncbi:HelD family protein [Thermoflavimicrobium daqui]|uniref:DNA helicase UvrD n=1 Tax=Thermoflavimicrobium daqui TaxID=2137476 RepID=A0A364K9I0_9BACL|nr:UvrD-helicase domain-containing protein [Thermoflavimicrobium daqui]RAL26860.1 DNA helicase UvrD [Thermoflavimicrobium daqui]